MTIHQTPKCAALGETRSPNRLRRMPGPCGAGIFDEATWRSVAVLLGLSTRELQVVRGVFNDGTEYAIASDLNISPHTVHTYVERLHQKLGVVDRVQLVLRVTQVALSNTVTRGSLPSESRA